MSKLAVDRTCYYNAARRSGRNLAPFIIFGAWILLNELPLFRISAHAAEAIRGWAFAGVLAAVPFVIRHAFRGRATLGERLRTHLEQRLGIDLANALHVGLSPGERVRVYEGDTDWDIGFLMPADGLTYYGDQYCFSINPGDIVSCKVRRSACWLWAPRLVVKYMDENDDIRAVALTARSAMSYGEGYMALERLRRSLALARSSSPVSKRRLPFAEFDRNDAIELGIQRRARA